MLEEYVIAQLRISNQENYNEAYIYNRNELKRTFLQEKKKYY